MLRRLALVGVIVVTGCGGPLFTKGGPDGSVVGRPCVSELDCGFDTHCEQGVCLPGAPQIRPNEVTICTRDEDCIEGLVCVRSTGRCVPLNLDDGGGEYDAGPQLACVPDLEQSCGVSKLGECHLGLQRCVADDAGVYGFTECIGAVFPEPELCDGKDNNCDGLTDEGFPDVKCGIGACTRTMPSCVGGARQVCTPGPGSPEVCNNIDDDCNGQVDDNIAPTTCGRGACARTVTTCIGGITQPCIAGPSSPETCNGIDDDCDGVVDNGVCAPSSTCSANQSVNPNTTVTLTTAATGRSVTCAWSVVSRPPTSSGTFSAPTSCASSTYFADVVGTHVLRFTVTDSQGMTSSCDTSVTVLPPAGGLWVELTWNHNNDVDLHLLHPSAGGSHSTTAWSTSPYDDYFANRTPSWDSATTTSDDPSLDRDDITGMGPENTRITVPSTSHGYTIGVFMYSYAASPSPVTSTVRVYCNGQLKTTQVHTSSTNRQMWVVGGVTFAGAGSANCIFTPDGYTMQMP